MTRTLALAAALAMVLSSTGNAAACRDAKGKFIKCPPAAAAKGPCKDAKGKFAKCTAPGAKPAK